MSFPFDLHSAAVSDSHLPCHAHAVLLKATARPSRGGRAVALRRTAWSEHGMGMAWAWHGHGMGMAWAWHGHGMGMEW